ncbi:hypothetical protein Y032_0758g2105 [Ancylostoma ceylanicum]|uniref:Uncharacterized protein n=1 Tax=Ancylostoma ceylanicum TaxID=53326 RepID=A0A016WDI0_9BILA|nr:hypothetical protein Y032_0758g2105 [Ancylostoma ceylanicum]
MENIKNYVHRSHIRFAREFYSVFTIMRVIRKQIQSLQKILSSRNTARLLSHRRRTYDTEPPSQNIR